MRVAVVSGGRADYGLLVPVMKEIAADPRLELSLMVTGQHLSEAEDAPLEFVARDGLTVDARLPILSGSDSTLDVARATGRAVTLFADAFADRPPDLVMVLGDRYEILAVTLAAHILRIPVAHLMGGDVTDGAIDDAFRHSITKLSHLHFVSTAQAAARVMQLGETAETVHVVGSPGLDLIRMTPDVPREDFFSDVGLRPGDTNLVVTFHPVTAEDDSVDQIGEMLAALGGQPSTTHILFTGINADAQGETHQKAVIDFCRTRPNSTFRHTLGARLYFAALRHCDVLVGNSSSGLYEAPSFGIPVVNIGSRQNGRIRASSIIDVRPERNAIAGAIEQALSTGRRDVANPYGDGHSAERIVAVLRGVGNPRTLLRKRFVDHPVEGAPTGYGEWTGHS